jgi:hypothetical protein
MDDFKSFSDAYDIAYKKNPEKYTVAGDRISPILMFEMYKEKKRELKQKKKVSLRDLIQQRKNTRLYSDIFDTIDIAEAV